MIERAAAIFDRVVVGVVGSPRHKETLFSLDERVEFLQEALAELDNVEVDVFSELVVEFARRWEAKVIVKGLRVISDFEWEFQMNQLNRHLAPEIETVYVMASPQVSFVSSSGVKEIAAFGGKVDELVPGHRGAPARGEIPERPSRQPLKIPGSRLRAMDVLVLIDKLDDLVHNAKAVPLTDQVRIDREEIYDILDQMRATIPEEIKQARWIVKERQEMLAEAKRETDRILGEAREQAVREASQTEIVKLAERQAQEIVDDARRQARETRLEMEDWADGILSTLEVNLDKFLSAVKRGRERLHERSQETVVAGVGPREPARTTTALPVARRSALLIESSAIRLAGDVRAVAILFEGGPRCAAPSRRLGRARRDLPDLGSTYLGIELAMRTMPPLLVLSLRFLDRGQPALATRRPRAAPDAAAVARRRS